MSGYPTILELDRFGQPSRVYRREFIMDKNIQCNLGRAEGTSTDSPF